MSKFFYFKTKIGVIKVGISDGEVVNIGMADEYIKGEKNLLANKVFSQIEEYLAGKRKKFDFPIRLCGTEFQKKVWQALTGIPYGETKTYGEIAREIGNPKSARAVGSACNKNPILLAVPCHRVIGANGSLVGFAIGTDIKKKLLDIEKK